MQQSNDSLAAMLDELIALSGPTALARAASLRDRLVAGELRVALVGEAKRGKSTLGNAILGADVLPAGVVPVTAISTEVHGGEPQRAEVVLTDGSVRVVEMGEVEQFVSERHNADNHRHVKVVRLYLDDGMPHPRMVLVDTPGVGSVHHHNTEQARSAFASMDAAVFVLTADPPISSSELTLLREVAADAVRVFVVLNKADQLEAHDLKEATGFVTDVVTGALGARPRLWVCSARNGLRARAAGADAAWAASGVPALLEALLAHVTVNRERDLRVSVAAAAGRVAAQQLDDVNVTTATARALENDQEHLVRELTSRLDAIDQRCEQAVDFVDARLRAQRSRLDVDAFKEVRRVRPMVGDRLETFLADTELAPPDLEDQGRMLIAEVTQAAVEAWRTGWHDQLTNAVGELLNLEQSLLKDATGDLHSAALELLGVHIRSEVPELAPVSLSRLRYDFGPEVGWNTGLVSGARRHSPVGVRRRVARFLRSEAARLVDKHVGRARADLQGQLEEVGRRLRAQVRHAFDALTNGMRAGQQAAWGIRSASEPGQRAELELLGQRRMALERLLRRLQEGADVLESASLILGAASDGLTSADPAPGTEGGC